MREQDATCHYYIYAYRYMLHIHAEILLRLYFILLSDMPLAAMRHDIIAIVIGGQRHYLFPHYHYCHLFTSQGQPHTLILLTHYFLFH